MRVKRAAGDGRVRVAVFDKGDEVMAKLGDYARAEGISSCQVSGIGAASAAVLAFFDRESMGYRELPVDEQVEIVSLSGNIALKEGEPFVHLHAVMSRSDGSTVGGHLLEATVWPTLEMYLVESALEVHKQHDDETGLFLMHLA